MNGTGEPTAWEDINPTTALARRHERQLQCSARLVPADNTTFRNELTACLTLVAPVGMTEEAKRDWLAVAWGTLKHLPPDLLALGCKAAREKCDHPSRIVPMILAETKQAMTWRREVASDTGAVPLSLPKPDVCTPEEARAILEEYGFKPKRVTGRA